MSTIQTLERVFKMGATLLRDIDPSWSVQQVIAAYTPSYPFLAHATVGEPTVEGDKLVYEVHRPVAQTKGAGDVDKTLAAIEAWLNTPPPTHNLGRWSEVLSVLDSAGKSDERALLIQPTLIPMA